MTAPLRQPDVDRLAALARADAPAPLRARDAERMIEQATAAALARAARRRPGQIIVAAAAGLALAAAVMAAIVLLGGRGGGRGVGAGADPPLRLTLPSGDRLLATPGAQFGIESLTAAERSIALTDGTLLVDAAPLGHGQQLEVVTAEARVVVVGTVFIVEVKAGVTTVVVYEGTVRVISGAATRELHAGDAWASTGTADPVVGALAEAAVEAAARRGAVVTSEPIGEPAPAVEQPPTPALPLPGGGRTAPAADPLGEADRLRAGGRLAEAARAYETAAARLRGDDAATAGYQAAYLYAHRLDAPDAALRVLDASRADRAGAPLEERALVLRITVLDRTGGEAAAAIARYLARFPDGDWAATLRGRAPRSRPVP